MQPELSMSRSQHFEAGVSWIPCDRHRYWVGSLRRMGVHSLAFVDWPPSFLAKLHSCCHSLALAFYCASFL
jgi:hypothetical protein